MQVLGYVTILTTFRKGGSTKTVKVRYMVVNALSPYNIVAAGKIYRVATILYSFLRNGKINEKTYG